MFPSLTGVILFFIATKQYKKISTDKFPSLTGVIRFLISHQTICENLNSIDLVSVPYRGYSFFNFIGKSENGKSIVLKFPSLTGVIRFLINWWCAYISNVFVTVSVPYRGYSFFNLVHWFNWCYRNVSVPYRGYSFFNQCDFSDRIDKSNIVVSVPYRGYSFFNWRTKKQQKTQKQRFRPLQGLFVF